jgi:cytochrome P450
MKKYFLHELSRFTNSTNIIQPVKIFGESFLFTNNEKFIRHIEAVNPSNYSGGMGMGSCEEFNFSGVINKDKEFANTLKKIIPSAFIWTNAAQDFSMIVEETERMFDRWIGEGRRESVINAELEFQRLALFLSAQLFISPDLELNVDPVIDGLSDLMDISNVAEHQSHKTKKRFGRVLPFINNLAPLFNTASEFVELLAGQLTEEYLRKNTKKGFLFERIFQSHADGALEFTSFIPIMKYFILTGPLATAELLTWLFYSIDTIPGLRKKLESEVENVCGNGELTLEAVKSMQLLRSVILETLRFYTPVTVYQKTTFYKDEFEGTLIPPNAHILVSPYTLHRKASLWKDGETFKPDRFINAPLPENGFMPFGDNIINTASQDIILLELQIITAVLLRKVHVYYQVKEAPVFRATPVLSPNQRILALAVKVGNDDTNES